jgi:hypothetical protein
MTGAFVVLLAFGRETNAGVAPPVVTGAMDVSDNEATLAEGLSENRGSPVADDPQALAQGAHAYVVSVYASGHHSLSMYGVFARACDTQS